MPAKERIALRLSRIQRLMVAVERKRNEAIWTLRPCCQRSGEERFDQRVKRLQLWVQSLEADVILYEVGEYR